MRARLAAVFAATAATALLLGAAPALATVTGSTITSMTTADGFASNPVISPIFSGYDYDAATAQVTVGGTTTTDDNNVADTVNVRCYYGDGNSYKTLVTGVAVGADGTFNATGPANNIYEYTCRLAAVPSTYSGPLDFTKFAGPIAGTGYQETYKISGGPNDGMEYDYYSDAHQLKGAIGVYSSGDCGIDETSSINAALYDNYDQYGFADCAAALFTAGSGDDYGRSEIQVDGKNAYNSYGSWDLADDGNSHNPDHNGNFPVVTSTNKVDPTTGNMTTTESEQLVDCGSAAYPATAQCDQGTNTTQASFHDTGVHFDRTYQTGVDGQRVTVTDTYTSTDGAAHPLDVEYDNYSYEDTSVFDFPGSAGFNYYSQGDSVDLPAQAVGTIYTQDAYYPSAQDYSRPSSLTYMTQPDRAFFNYNGAEFALQYRRTIPAGGSTSITHVYNYSTTPEGIRALAGQTQNAASPPAIAITSPANGTSSSSHKVVVTGTASDDGGAPSVTVNGIATPVQPDGSWSQDLELPTGGNTITAVATDSAGNQAQAQTTVNVAIAQCTVPKVTGMTTAQATAALTGAGCKVGSQTKATSKTVKSGSVITQSIPAGLVGSLGLPVDIRISLGKFTGASLASKSIKLNGRSLVVTVKCGSSPVQTGTVKLRTTSGKKKKTLGSAAFSCPKGKKRTVHFTISKTSAKALKKQKKTKATAFIVARNTTGDSASKTGKLTIKG